MRPSGEKRCEGELRLEEKWPPKDGGRAWQRKPKEKGLYFLFVVNNKVTAPTGVKDNILERILSTHCCVFSLFLLGNSFPSLLSFCYVLFLYVASPQGNRNENDPNNTTIFVGNLDSDVTEDHLREVFSPYGRLVHVKIPRNKGCGFVQFADRSCAEEALRILNGTQLGGQSIRLSWGRSTPNKQAQSDPNQWNSGYYRYGQGYGYGYAAASQDPNMYYGGYHGYGNYQQPQQQQQVGYS
ncbi:polyadenylate-binding protein RBP45-like [Hibiscus syriacus]|uniref:polyadenylate-binding protein RBP45-like n=1 Tax=Hibiscus syriacus TaxID=106335 RepID=UPI001924DED4|nr:polyadenylate-binding protein RBP45-like [Hibiscus syriacus]